VKAWRWRPAAAVAGVLAAGGLVLSACGIPTEVTARSIPVSQVPPSVLAPFTATTRVPTHAATTRIYVYFTLPNDSVKPEARLVKPPASLSAVMDVLLGGPTTHERIHTGLGTALGSGVRLLTAQVSGDVITLNFNGAFGELSGSQEVLGVAQVVYTVAGALKNPTVGVSFEIDGSPIAVPLANGAGVGTPVHEQDYYTLLYPAGGDGGTG
jgi:Sporulation and spore germination